jgi:hypothetical protein
MFRKIFVRIGFSGFFILPKVAPSVVAFFMRSNHLMNTEVIRLVRQPIICLPATRQRRKQYVNIQKSTSIFWTNDQRVETE